MEKIDLLLEKLDNRITSSLAKRLDTLDDLQEKIEVVSEEYEKNPTDDNKANYEEVIDYVEKMELGIIRDLEALLEKRRVDELAKQNKANQPAPIQSQPITPETPKEEKKESSGVLGLVIGAVLLVGSLGAINYFKNNR
jgi:hypothetical protein